MSNQADGKKVAWGTLTTSPCRMTTGSTGQEAPGLPIVGQQNAKKIHVCFFTLSHIFN